MRSVIIVAFILLVGCATYSKIDAQNWQSFSHNFKDIEVSYSLPGGYIISKFGAGENRISLAAYDYDVLSGTGIYGSPMGETSISIWVSQKLDPTPDEHLKGPLDSTCEREPSGSWVTIICNKPEPGYYREFHIASIGNEEYLYVFFNIDDKAYKRVNVRAERQRMIQDIMATVRFKNA